MSYFILLSIQNDLLAYERKPTDVLSSTGSVCRVEYKIQLQTSKYWITFVNKYVRLVQLSIFR